MPALTFKPIDETLSVVGAETTAIARALSITVGLECRNGRTPSPLTYAQALDIIAWRERAEQAARPVPTIFQRVRRVLGFPTRH